MTKQAVTERKDHLKAMEDNLTPRLSHLIVLRAGQRKKQERALKARLAGPPQRPGSLICGCARAKRRQLNRLLGRTQRPG